MAKWMVSMKKADFQTIAEKYKIDPVLARIIRNRDIVEDDDIRKFLNGNTNDLYAPDMLKDMEKGVSIILDKIDQGKKIRIIGDYDIDGVCSTYILYRGLTYCGAMVDMEIPHRMKDGYGLNERLIQDAFEDGIDTVITCDNGIAAKDQIAYAKELGMSVVVTDHHEVPYSEETGERIYILPPADAVIDPKQIDCKYPFSEICGAVVAYKFVLELLAKKEHSDWRQILDTWIGQELMEFAAFATIGDVMELRDENRIIVKQGLKNMANTKNLGMKCLIDVSGVKADQIKPYTIGFVLGPCLNATGRLDTAANALDLFCEKDEAKAMSLAGMLKAMNDSRKDLTLEGTKEAIRQIEEEHMQDDKVLVVYLPEVHESLAGIIAGRIREKYGKPTFIMTKGEEGVKGSGRSIDAFHMYDEMTKCKELFTKYGGHKLAAGFSLQEENVSLLHQALNENCTLTDEDFEEKITIDVPMPMSYASLSFIEKLDLLEPFGNGNPKPLFAEKNVRFIKGRILGQNRNVGKYTVSDQNGKSFELIYFGDLEALNQYMVQKFGQDSVDDLYRGSGREITMSIIYYPDINEYRGIKTPQMVLKYYQ